MEIRANGKVVGANKGGKMGDRADLSESGYRVVEMWNGEFVVQKYDPVFIGSWLNATDGRFKDKKEALEYAEELWERDKDYILRKQVKKVIKTYG